LEKQKPISEREAGEGTRKLLAKKETASSNWAAQLIADFSPVAFLAFLRPKANER
jgi:hypothetical protein